MVFQVVQKKMEDPFKSSAGNHLPDAGAQETVGVEDHLLALPPHVTEVHVGIGCIHVFFFDPFGGKNDSAFRIQY